MSFSCELCYRAIFNCRMAIGRCHMRFILVNGQDAPPAAILRACAASQSG